MAVEPAADWWIIDWEAKRTEYVGPPDATLAQAYRALAMALDAEKEGA